MGLCNDNKKRPKMQNTGPGVSNICAFCQKIYLFENTSEKLIWKSIFPLPADNYMFKINNK